MIKNLRDGLKSNKPQAKVKTSKELAYIRLLEGNIKLALNFEDEALEAYDKAKSTLVSIESSAQGIKGLLDYQYGEVAKKNHDHDSVIKLINSSVNNLKEDGKYIQAIKYLFDLTNYIIVNRLKENPMIYTSLIDQISKKHIKDKNEKKRYSAELRLLKGKFYRISNKHDAAKEFENAAKSFSSLNLYNKHAESMVQWAELIRNESLNKSEKLINSAIESAEKGNSDREKGLAYVSLAKIERIRNKLDIANNLEKEGFEALCIKVDTEECGDQYIEMSRIILLTSTNDDELAKAFEYASKAREIFDEIDHKYGKTVSIFMQGLIRIARGEVKEGLSMIKLTTINLSRLQKTERVEYLNTKACYLVDALSNDLEGVDFIIFLEENSENLDDLEKASLYHLASIIKIQTHKNDGQRLINDSLSMFQNFIEKNQDYHIFNDIAKERTSKME